MTKEKTQIKTEKDIFYKKLISLVMPIAFQQFMLALVSASDALMLGFLSQNSMSAVSLAGQITFVQNLFLAASAMGLSLLAAQYWGKEDIGAVERIFAYVLKVATLVSLAFFGAALLIPQSLMRILTNEPELIADGAVYLRAVSPSYLLTGISQMYLCIFKNSKRAGLSSLISSVSVVVNIILNAVFIFGLIGLPKMGVAGAAIATTVAKAIELIWCLIETAYFDSVKLRASNLAHNDKILRRDYWKYSTPVIGNELAWGLGFATFSVIMGHMGKDAVAANAVANIVKNLLACFCLGLASGGGIMVGNELGAGKLDVAKSYGKRLCKMSFICGTATGLVLIALIPAVLRVANLSDQAAYYLKWMLVICSVYMVGKAVNCTTIAGLFCAGGDSTFGFILDIIAMWVIVIPLGFLSAFVFKWPVLAVYFIISLDETIKMPLSYLHYRKYKWVKDLTVKE